MEQWLSYLAGVVVAIILVSAIHVYRVNRWYDLWILQYGDFLIFEQVEFESYWNGRQDGRNKTSGNRYVFYLTSFTYRDINDAQVYFRAPIEFEKLTHDEKRIMFIMHYRRVFDVTPDDVSMKFAYYL